ncbi:MAG TPA: TonB family protein [Gemmatimonadales bacterium]|nr:TonB family protein [Gemmatimonadales bacterium]
MGTVAWGEATAKIEPASSKPPVRFRLLDRLLYSFPSRSRSAKDLIPATMFAALHLSGLLALRQPSPDPPAPAKVDMEAVTYLDVPPPAEPASPRRLMRPRPIAVSDAVTIPAAQGEMVHPEKSAGFQVLLLAHDLHTLPPLDVSGAGAVAVDERDYSGRGVVGGVAGGKPVPVLPAALAAELAQQGRLSDDLAAAGLLDADRVDVKPELVNRTEVMELLLAAYPPQLQAAGVEGSVRLGFVVDTAGHVVARSVHVVSSTEPLFVPAALRVIRYARFSPGRMAAAGAFVAMPVLVQMPLTWITERK